MTHSTTLAIAAQTSHWSTVSGTVPKATLRNPTWTTAICSNAASATALHSTGAYSANATTVTSPTTAETAFFNALTRASGSARTRPRPATSMTPNAAPK